MPRSVTLVLCPGAPARVCGVLPSFEVVVPHWPEVTDVVAGARAVFGLDVAVLRLLRVEDGRTAGGAVTYLAEVDRPPDRPLAPWIGPDPLADHPLRAAWARPGGPRAALDWADGALGALGTPRTGTPVPQRTWNLSAIWRLPTAQGPVWLKAVPPFFAHEPALLRLLPPAPVPALLAAADGRMLLADVPGIDHYETTGPPLHEMLRHLLDLQQAWAGRVPDLLAAGVPDRRPAAALPLVVDVAERHAPELEADDRARLDGLVADLPARFTAVAACGLPDTLVHGDFHPGNVRGVPGALVLLDWGDACVGHPALDWLRFANAVPAPDRAVLEPEWAAAWRRAVPGSDPLRAAALLRPWAALLGAVTYRRFLDHIEPDEHPYHAADPARCLRAALRTREW